VFQIIDRHAYRAVDALHVLAATSSGAPFRELDRILCIFDRQQNGSLSETPIVVADLMLFR
jgi:hypothetical protein